MSATDKNPAFEDAEENAAKDVAEETPAAPAGEAAVTSGEEETEGEEGADKGKEPEEETIKKSDKVYFDSYAHVAIHEEMLRDVTRTQAYQSAILNNREDFEGKVVLDLGCGSGILSFFCVQAGAARVYAVDASDIADQCKLVVEDNGMSDRITVLKGKIEELELPEQVDVIVSEWMGYFLFYECMLQSVIYARDKWLKPGGLMYPSSARLYIAPFWDESSYNTRVEFWRNVYGIDMSAMMPFAKKCIFKDPVVDVIYPQALLTAGVQVLEVTMADMTTEDADANGGTFEFRSFVNSTFQGLATWFDVSFDRPFSVTLNTTPEHGGYTHWKQTLFYVEEPVPVQLNQIVSGTLSFVKAAEGNVRGMDVTIEYDAHDGEGVRKQTWGMK